MNVRGLRSLAPLAFTLATGLVACAASRGFGADARFDAVKDTLSAMGLAQIHAPDHATIAPGGEARRNFDLAAGCVTFVVVGDENVRDVDLAVLDSMGRSIAHDTTRAPQAIVRVCSDVAAMLTLVVTARSGGGAFTLGIWSGAIPDALDGGAPAPSASQSAPLGAGTCASPIEMSVGETHGSLPLADGVIEGSCGRTSGAETVYALDVRARSQVSLEVRGSFDTVLYLRRADCAEPSAEIACNDDATSANDSRIDTVVDPGQYYVFVDGHAPGTYVLATRLTVVPSTADICRRARPLVVGELVTGDSSRSVDAIHATCGGGAHGLDTAFRFDVAERERVRFRESSDEFHPLLHARRVCTSEQSELACSGADTSGAATLSRVLDRGSYSVFADGEGEDVGGHFTLRAETAPAAGSGTLGDACSTALPLIAGQEIAGDTFTARDDVTTTCGAPRTADVVYRIDIAQPSRVHAELLHDEGRHVLAIERSCGDASTEVACASVVDEQLAPGAYAVVVEDATPDEFGGFTLRLDARDVAVEAAACKKVARLTAGHTISGTLDGAPDRFAASCAYVDGGANGDRLYSFDLAAPADVHISLETAGFSGAVALRRRCVDSAYSPKGVEIECSETPSGGSTSLHPSHRLEAGTYFVVVEGRTSSDSGTFKLGYTTTK
jgi:hypothetical protein